MERDIVAKLAPELAPPIDSEVQVLYIMAEIRKLLESMRHKRALPDLYFHTDWVAYPVLDQELAEKMVKALNKKAKMFHGMTLKTRDGLAIDDNF